MRPDRMVRAMKMGNEAGAMARAVRMQACDECTAPLCEKACLRERIDHAVQIPQSGVNWPI